MDTSAVVLQVVLLEDNSADAELVQLELRRSGIEAEYRLAATEADFVQVISHSTPDLVLADYALPGFNGLNALKLLRASLPDVPFIFVSGSLGEERAIEALKSGATDYVLKDRLQRLPAVVRRALTEAHERRERRSAQAALEEQRELLAALINNLPEDIYAVDASQRVTVINRAMLERLNLPRGAVLGRRLNEIISPEAAYSLETPDRHVLNSGVEIADQEHAVEMSDGSLRWVISSRVPLKDHNTGKVTGVICTERDITARKELEREILEISNREQRRLGSDLHDGLGQELTGLSLMMKGLEVQLSREAPQYLPQAAKISELLAQTIQSTRSLARGLAPVNLERGGLREALRHLALRCSDLYQMNCVFDDRRAHVSALDEGLATHLFRVAQEASTNAARHAKATRVRIELRTTATRLYLSITDDGIGLAAGLNAGKPGMGLKIMEYRARVIGGSIEFHTLNPGTRIALSCPLELLQRNANANALPRTA